jgi:cytochrome P450
MREALKRLCERRKVPDLGTLFAKETRTIVQRLLQSANPFGRVDVVGDIGRVVPVMLAERIWGVAGPGFVSPTGVAAKFARSAVTDMAPSWPRSLPAIPDNLKPLTTMQAWCRLAFLQIFVNVINRSDLATIAQSSTLELMQHIEGVITKARMHKPRNEETLVGCLVQMGDKPSDHNMSQQKFDEHMRLILAELVVGGIETCNKALASIVNYALDHRNVLDAMVDAIEDDADDELDKLIREALRHDPVSPILFRVAARDGKIGGKDVARGTLVCLLVQAAMMDPRVFGHEPTIFAPNNNPENYLHFGTAGPLPAAPHACAGRDFVGAELRELVRAIVALRRLRRAAGPLGNRIDESRLPTSMVLRFDPA